MSVARALNEWSADAHGTLGVIHSSIHSHLPSHGISSWVNEITSCRVKPCVSSASSNIIISCTACQLCRVSPDAQEDNLQPRGNAEAHRSSPAATPMGGFSLRAVKHQSNAEKDGNTHSCGDWRQLHQPVRTDGADIPGCTGGRVRRGDPRSNQQPGIHPHCAPQAVNDERLACVWNKWCGEVGSL